MNVPRLLPLIGIAVVGVIGVNALSGARDLPQMLSAARAYAEGAANVVKGKSDAAKSGKEPKPDEAAKTASVLPAGQSGPALPPASAICAASSADLAKEAGLTQGEWDQLRLLQARRLQIEGQSKDVDTQTQLMNAAEAKLDAKFKAMADLKAQIEALMGQADQKTQAEVDRLTVVYSKMKPADAAAVMAQLDDKVRVPIAASMKPAVLSAILAKMSPPDAKKLTELLAHRYATVQALADAAKAPPAAPPAKPDPKADAKADPKAKPAAQAAAKPSPDDANVDDGADKPAKAKAKPKQLAKKATPKKKPAAAAKKAPVEEAKATSGPKPYSEVKDQSAKPADKPATAAPAAAAKT